MASTIGVYGGITQAPPYTEDMPLPLAAGHAIPAFKKIGELLADHLSGQTGTQGISYRIAGVWGPLGRETSAFFGAPQLVHAAVRGTTPDLSGLYSPAYAGDGLDLCYVKDAARAIALLQLAPQLPHRTYNVASGHATSYGEVAAAIKKVIPGAQIELPPGRKYDASLWRWSWAGFDIAMASCFAAAAWLGWQRRRQAVTFMAFTAALLCCDAWFDVTLDWGSGGEWSSIAMAVLVELPLAGLLLARARDLLTGDMPRREFTVADIDLHTDPLSRQLQDSLTKAGPATTADLAGALSLSTAELSPLLDRLTRAGYLRRTRDGRWQLRKQTLQVPSPDGLDTAGQDRLQAFYNQKYEHELRLFTWAAEHRGEFGPWGQGHRGSTHLTEAELREFSAEYGELLARYCLLHDTPGPGTREIAIRWYAFPSPQDQLTAASALSDESVT